MSVQVIRLSADQLTEALPHPARDADKYTRGKLTVIGGSAAYPGSVCLASKAGLLAGAGYVECACSAEAVPLVRAFAPSLVVRAWGGVTAHGLKLDALSERHPQACVIGCGMAADGGAQDALVKEMVVACEAPLIMDGGALRTVAERDLLDAVRARAGRGLITALTPHGGEAAALAGAAGVSVPARDAHAREMAAYAKAVADAFSALVLLKGPVSFIASPATEAVCLMDQGTPALAKAGTGDVLAGVTGAFLAQGVDPFIGCVLASTIHAEAGRAASQRLGVISVTAEEVLASLPQAIQSL